MHDSTYRAFTSNFGHRALSTSGGATFRQRVLVEIKLRTTRCHHASDNTAHVRAWCECNSPLDSLRPENTIFSTPATTLLFQSLLLSVYTNTRLLCPNSYTSRLDRLKRGAGETLALWGDEFEEQLTAEDFGFVDPSAGSENDVGSENNSRPGTGGGGGELGAMEIGDEGGNGDAAVTVGDGDNVLLAGGGGVGVEDGGAAAVAPAGVHDGAPVPHPMDVEESEWDSQGDCVPLPPWKVSYACRLEPQLVSSG